MNSDYNGALTREQFLFYEIRIVARLIEEGLSRDEIAQRIIDDNLFQFPTEREIKSKLKACFNRIDSLNSDELVDNLAYSSVPLAKQINLYAMMRYNRIVWDFMTTIIGEKYRTQEFDFSRKDLNIFFSQLQEQNDKVASWSDQTISKIKQILTKCLVECDYLDSVRADHLNTISIEPELEDAIRDNNDLAALPAFNCFN